MPELLANYNRQPRNVTALIFAEISRHPVFKRVSSSDISISSLREIRAFPIFFKLKPGMELSKNNAIALLLDINQNIEEYAEATVKNIVDDKNFDSLLYPPNGGLTDAEKAELSKLNNNENLKNALRKIIADTTAGVIFNTLNLLDGTASPNLKFEEWTGVKLVDNDGNPGAEPFSDTLHDGLYELYWEWKRLRGEKPWKLDIL
jgi:hypothetical protein